MSGNVVMVMAIKTITVTAVWHFDEAIVILILLFPLSVDVDYCTCGAKPSQASLAPVAGTPPPPDYATIF